MKIIEEEIEDIVVSKILEAQQNPLEDDVVASCNFDGDVDADLPF